MATRSKTQLFLIGARLDQFSHRNLPTTIDVLRRLFCLGQNTSENRALVVDEVLELWDRAKIPTRERRNVLRKLEAVVVKYVNQKKSSKRAGGDYSTYLAELAQLFDIAHHDADKIISIEEDRIFLHDQRTHRRMSMGTFDAAQVKKEQKILQRRNEEQRRKEKEAERRSAAVAIAELSGSSSTSSSEREPAPPSRPSSSSTTTTKRMKMSPGIAAALDRTRITPRQAAHVLKAVGESEDFSTPSVSTIHRTRRVIREERADAMKIEFQELVDSADAVLVLHWDSKHMPDIAGGTQRVDRLAIVVTSPQLRHEKILAVSPLPSGTGKAMAMKAADVLEEWNLADRVAALSFDTTSSNTGLHGGCCTLLEQRLGRSLLHLACRHHVMELVLAAAFKAVMGPSSGPDIQLFKRFRDRWNFIAQDAAIAFADPRLAEPQMDEWRVATVASMKGVEDATRDDYKEFRELVLAAATGNVPASFRRPGAFHHARWMAKAIYTIKLSFFRQEFKLTTSEVKAVQEMVLFLVTIYGRAWVSAPRAEEAAVGDLSLLRDLQAFRSVNPVISAATVHVLKRHLWYLGTENIGLAIFSRTLSTADKDHVAAEIKKEKPALERRKWVPPEEIPPSLRIGDLCSAASLKIFDLLHLSKQFLDRPASEWSGDAAFRTGEEAVARLRVVNDVAERAIKLMSDFNVELTNDESQKQALLQSVEWHRRGAME